MPRHPKKRPCNNPPVTPDKHVQNKRHQAAALASSTFGLSKAEFDKVVKTMKAVVRRMGCPVHVQPLDIVHDAFVMAAAKPISERKSILEKEKFVPWLCTLTEYAVMNNCKAKHRRSVVGHHSEEELAELLPVSGEEERIIARELVDKTWALLRPVDQQILKAYYIEEKTIQEIATKQKVRWSTTDSRFRRAMDNFRRIVQSLIAAIILFMTKRGRAQSARLTQQLPRLLMHTMQPACAMSVMVACGVMVPSASAATAVSQGEDTASVLSPPNGMIAVAAVPTAPASTTPVEQSKLILVDMAENQCSACDMNSSKIASYLWATFLPTTLLVAPAVTQIACAGAEHHTPPPQEPEEEDGSIDPYVSMCEDSVRLGGKCPTREQWYGAMGRCPDGTPGCQKK